MTYKKKSISLSSNRWLKEHSKDKYVQKAHENGLRSRAWFKLAEIQQSDRLFKSGMTVIDLGAAPGGWSQYAVTKIGKKGRVIACDLLPMNPITGVEFFQGDFSDKMMLRKLLKYIGNNKVQIIMSDMSPNICGISDVDIPRTIYLVELALKMCCDVLTSNGSFIVKIFQGEGFKEYLKEVRLLFTEVKIRKPKSSRAHSREEYIVATGHKP